MSLKQEIMYRCGSGPSPEFTYCDKAEAGIRQPVDGSLYLSDPTNGEFQARMSYLWSCDFEKTVEIETRVKVETCEEECGVGVAFGDGRHFGLITFFSDAVAIQGAPDKFLVNTTREFHTYKIIITNPKIEVYVDGNFALEGKLIRRGCREQIGFGSFGNPGAAYWEYFKVSHSRRSVLSGGTIEFGGSRVICEHRGPLNFPCAHRFSDGRIWLMYSVGRHVENERKAALWSNDDGNTWFQPDLKINPLAVMELENGDVLFLNRQSSCGKTVAMEKGVFHAGSHQHELRDIHVELPFEGSFYNRRSIIRLKDGRMITCGYGKVDSESKYSVLILESRDGGDSWQYLSKIDSRNSLGPEGFNESCLLALDNGDILCQMRTGGDLSEWLKPNVGPLMQARSNDAGKTWDVPQSVCRYGVAPHMIKLANGSLVSVSGRPGLYLLVDFTGTGEHWQKMDVYFGEGSSYANLLEIAPNKIMLIYDESEFCLNPGNCILNRIISMEMDVTK